MRKPLKTLVADVATAVALGAMLAWFFAQAI
jgi:hypothetical protein